MGLLLLSLLPAMTRSDIRYAEVAFSPDVTEKCAPTEITLTFQIEGGVQHLDTARGGQLALHGVRL